MAGRTDKDRGSRCYRGSSNLPIQVVPVLHLFGGGVGCAVVVFLHQMGEFMVHDLRDQN